MSGVLPAGAHAAAGTKQQRNSNFELLRIIAMVLIVAHHYSIHGITTDASQVTAAKCFADVLIMGGKVGVDLFVLISGYFMVTSRFTLKKFVVLYSQVLFYSVGMLLLFLFVLQPVEPIGKFSIVTSFFPVAYSKYWFVTCYIMLMLFSPYLNLLVHALDRSAYKRLIIMVGLLWSVAATFLYGSTYAYSELGWFVFVYLVAGYLRLYGAQLKPRRWGVWSAVLGCGLFASPVVFDIGGGVLAMETLAEHSTYFVEQNSVLVIGFSVALFQYFAQRKPLYSRAVNTVASATFGVYLIHDNIIMRPYLWQSLLHNQTFYGSALMPVHAVLSIAGVYVVCTLIELLRKRTVERAVLVCYDHLEGPTKAAICRARGKLFPNRKA